MKIILTIIFSTTFIFQTHSQSDLKNFPAGASPQEIGLRVATHFAESPHPRKNRIIYPEVCAWYGALTFADLTKNKTLSNQLEQRLAKLVSEEKALIPPANHVDFNVFGTIPLEQYLQTRNPEYLKLGIAIADSQWLAPTGKLATPEALNYHEKGYTYQTRLWIDDMFMITEVQSQAYRATGDVKYINRAAKEMVMYLDSLQKPNGLFYHAPDVPYFWSRGCGWMAAGMSELLRALPKNNPDRPRIMQGYKLMMELLLKYQTKEGMWNQLIDDPNSWAETSGTGMFTFAMITGVKNGWLDKKIYGTAARKGWLALITYINENNDVREVCEGTNKKNDHQYYLDRKRIVGDMHGQAPVLWCASALLR
jgi:unsaturated rhamnogalacturonyl hydrolase